MRRRCWWTRKPCLPTRTGATSTYSARTTGSNDALSKPAAGSTSCRSSPRAWPGGTGSWSTACTASAHLASRSRHRWSACSANPARWSLPPHPEPGAIPAPLTYSHGYGRTARRVPGGYAVNFSRFFVDRPIFASVLSIIIFVVGLISIPQLPISEYPEVVPPSVLVSASYPGANPQTISETVATPLEEAINGVENMIYMKSVAGSDGSLALTVTFALGTDPDQAQVQVQNRVSQALPRLPEDVRQLGVTTRKQSPTLMMAVHLTS